MLGIKKEENKEKNSSWMVIVGVILVIIGIVFVASYFYGKGSGNIVEERRSLSSFSKIEIDGSGDVTLDQNGMENVTIKTDDNILPNIKTEIINDTLVISQKNNWYSFWPTNGIIYQVSTKGLSGITVKGSAKISSNEFVSDNININIIGSGDINMTLLVKSITADVSGSGNFNLSGTTDKQVINIDGSGKYQASSLKAFDTSINISGSGEATVRSIEKLDAKISGSGKINYYESPSINQTVSGSGSITKIGN